MAKFSRPILALFLSAAVTSGCSNSAAPVSPTSATPVTGASALGEQSNGESSADRSGAQSAGVVAEWAASHGWATAEDGLEVEGTDVITGVGGACPTVVITVRGVPVTVNSATVFTPGSSCSGLVAGARVAVRGLLTVTGGVLSVVATRIGLEGAPAPPPGPVGSEVVGTVVSILNRCPGLIITLQGIASNVVTSGTTVFEPSGGCGQIAVGRRVQAFGARNALNYFIANRVVIDGGGTGGGGGGGGGGGTGGGGQRVNGEGTIGAMAGTCPSLTMVITGARVQTTATTEFINGGCPTLRSGTNVRVHAETRPDGSYIAERVETLRTPGRPISGDGTVSSVSGACPALTMMVRGYPVRTSASTTFTGGMCESIGAGTNVGITGTVDDTGVDAAAVAVRR